MRRVFIVAAAAGFFALGLPSAASATPPLATTKAANPVAYEEATLRATVNPLGLKTNYIFEYGTSEKYGSETVKESAGSGIFNVEVSATIKGLSPGTTYHFRIVATNISGTTNGADETFATPQLPWSLQATPNPAESFSDVLNSVSCVSSSECMAVGDSDKGPMADEWDGSEWSALSTAGFNGEFESVFCTSISACTLVGFNGTQPVAARWDGSKWKSQEALSPAGAKQAQLNGVSCSSSTACTAVGWYKSSEGLVLTLAERWDGSEWKIQTTPNVEKAENFLESVSCSSSTACMAVGRHYGIGLAESWNGTEWKMVTTASGYPLSDVSCTASSACTAVGAVLGPKETVAERWNGSEWKVQSTPNPAESVRNSLEGVSCSSSNECTAAGWTEDGSELETTLVEHWDGSSWEIETTPNPAESSATLWGISCPSSEACEAVGAQRGTGSDYIFTLAEGYEGP